MKKLNNVKTKHPTVIGLSYDQLLNYQPEDPKHTTLIRFNSNDPEIDKNLPYSQEILIQADDIEEPINNCKLFSQFDAKKILKEVNHYNTYNVVVECNAGVSRSGAVVKFLENIYNYKNITKHKFAPNQHIYNTLVKETK